MNGRDLSQQMFRLALFILLLAGCAVAQAEPTATPVPPAATSAPLACDYVVLGDSIACGLPQLYATHLEADLGVEVRMHIWCAGDQSSSELLSALRDNQEFTNLWRQGE